MTAALDSGKDAIAQRAWPSMPDYNRRPGTTSFPLTAESDVSIRPGVCRSLEGAMVWRAVITPYFDSLLVKMRRGGRRCRRPSAHRPVASRVPYPRCERTCFLNNLILHPTFMSGGATTEFVDWTPELFRFRTPRDRATKVLSYLADVIVNGRSDVKDKIDPTRTLPRPVVPPIDRTAQAGFRQKLREWEMEILNGSRQQRCCSRHDMRVRTVPSETASNLRPKRLPRLCARCDGHFSLEMWGGATFDKYMRFLRGSVVRRVSCARESRHPVPMLLGEQHRGYKNYQTMVSRSSQKSRAWDRVFRIFAR